MRKFKIVALVVFGLLILIATAFLLVRYFKPKVAGIYIETTPSAMVYIDGLEVGRTPFEKTFKPGKVFIKLVPDSFEAPLAPYETEVELAVGAQTVIKRNFSETDDFSSGEIISFEKDEKGKVSLVVVTVPDSVELLIDGKERAFTPHKTTSLLPGVHKLLLKAEGYQEKEVDVKTHEGYKLTAIIKLAKQIVTQEEIKIEEESIIEEEIKTGKVKILSTPTGFLRVRSEPSTLGEEIGSVEPEEIHTLLETDEKTGWYKIEFKESDTEDSINGWITNQYAEIIEPLPSPSITPTPTD